MTQFPSRLCKKRSDSVIKTVSYYKPKKQRSNLDVTFHLIIQTFRFEDEDGYEYEISLEVFSRLPKIQTSWKASFYHFSLEKLALLSLVKEVTRSLGPRMIKLLTFDLLFRHHDFRVKTRSRMTGASSFSRQNDVGSLAYTT